MSTLSGAELFRSVHDVPRRDLRQLVGRAVDLLFARGDQSIFENTINNVGLGRCALAIYDVLDQADEAANSRRGAPNFNWDVEDRFDLRTLTEKVRTHPGGVDPTVDTDARELINTLTDLALSEPGESVDPPLITLTSMPEYDQLPDRVSVDILRY